MSERLNQREIYLQAVNHDASGLVGTDGSGNDAEFIADRLAAQAAEAEAAEKEPYYVKLTDAIKENN